jgi:uncharacterized membrane protein YedE/YeeE
MTQVLYWSGWIGGIAIGLYSIIQFYLTSKPLGVSSAFTDTCSIFSNLSFFTKNKEENGITKDSKLTWRIWFLLGIPLGGLIAALTSPGPWIASLSLGELYDSVLPATPIFRIIILTLGGIMIGYGSRMAGGCTSGHSIAGLGLLNWPSLIASVGFFAGGIIMVQFLFRFLGAM